MISCQSRLICAVRGTPAPPSPLRAGADARRGPGGAQALGAAPLHLGLHLASDLGGDRLSVDDARACHERSITLARLLGNGFFGRGFDGGPSMDVLTALRTRRSIRAFKPDPIDDALLRQGLDGAR